MFRSRSPITPADYHDMDAHNFEKWFNERLLPALKPNSIIVMDNAPYHSRKSVKLPTRGRRVEVISELTDMGFFQFLAARGLPHDPQQMTVAEVFALCRQYRSYFDKYAVDEQAKAHGHTVLRLPPYHCIFNPIEMVWAYQKHIVRSKSTLRTIQQAQEDCEDGFTKLPANGASPYFDHVERLEQEYRKIDCPVNVEVPTIIPLYDEEDDDDDDEPIYSPDTEDAEEEDQSETCEEEALFSDSDEVEY